MSAFLGRIVSPHDVENQTREFAQRKFARREKSEERWHTLRMKGDVTYLGRVDYRNDRRVFGIKREDRFAHVYAIGKTGTGKSTLLECMALQDLANGNGFALIDPLGDLAERVASRVPRFRRDDLIYLNAADPTCRGATIRFGMSPPNTSRSRHLG